MIVQVAVRRFAIVGFVAFVIAGGAVAASGPTCLSAPVAAQDFVPPRTPWGDPDIQGVWSGAETIGVPLDRDPQFGTRNVLTDQEFQARKSRLLESTSPDNIEATNFGAESELSVHSSRQASLVVDPPNGRRPPRTPAAEARQPARSSFSVGPFDSVADLGTYDRCIAFSTVPVASPSNGLQIVPGPGVVAIRTEVIHEARIVPLDGRPRGSAVIRSYMGDSRGRWVGRTLVVETTNMNGGTNLTGNGGGRPTDQVRITERFTLTDSNTLAYEATINDPGTWIQPWTIAFPRRREANTTLYEYACHEGNYGLPNILSASRAAEKNAAR
jgi:hypothetical protein